MRNRILLLLLTNSWARACVNALVFGLMLYTLTQCHTTALVRTRPPGARLFLGGQYMGKTPVKVKLKDGLAMSAGTSARLELEGHRTQSVLLAKGWSAGFILLDALVCIPTFGLGCYLIYFNGKTHDSEYDILMLEEEAKVPTAPGPRPARSAPPPSTKSP